MSVKEKFNFHKLVLLHINFLSGTSFMWKIPYLANFVSHASTACKFKMSQCEPARTIKSRTDFRTNSWFLVDEQTSIWSFGASRSMGINNSNLYFFQSIHIQRQPWTVSKCYKHLLQESDRNNSDSTHQTNTKR